MWILLVCQLWASDRIATVHVGVGLPDLLGGGVSLTAFRPLELEIGAATGILYTTMFVRAGGVLPLYDGRVTGEGVLVEGLALGGYRYLDQRPWTGDFSRHGAELNLAAEVSWWLTPDFALDAQLLGGGGLWIGSQPDGAAVFLDMRATVGVAF